MLKGIFGPIVRTTDAALGLSGNKKPMFDVASMGQSFTNWVWGGGGPKTPAL